jgi:four helix bundle protein
MATLTRFEDIDAWKKARVLTRLVYQASKDGAFSGDYALKDQMRRATVSIMSNIAEGFERRTTKECRSFFSVAKASAAEVKSHKSKQSVASFELRVLKG